MKKRDPFDFWYAVGNTRVVLAPSGRLETFGVTLVDYHLLSELPDAADRVRIREGRIEAARPGIITPGMMAPALEGFADEAAERYLDWLREHETEIVFLKYGFVIRKNEVRQEIVSDSLAAVTDRVAADLRQRNDPLRALVTGVDEPWEVCLLKLMVEMIRQSAPRHHRLLSRDPDGARHDIARAFLAARRDRGQLGALADLLREKGLFGEYEDRFFTVVRGHRA